MTELTFILLVNRLAKNFQIMSFPDSIGESIYLNTGSCGQAGG
jgi:hypothetical protein